MMFDHHSIEIECPRCRFLNDVFLWQVRLNDAAICRGCKVTLRIDDHLGGVTSGLARVEQAIESLNMTINLKIKL